MAVTILNTIKSWFLTGSKPTQAQFGDAWDSFRHKNDTVPAAEVAGLDALLLTKASQAAVDAHTTLLALKETLANKGVADGYAPLNELVKITSVYLNIVDDLTTGGSTALASAETVKTLKGLIDGINVILGSDNVDLNNVQELVDAIETVQLSLSTILIDDLTTGGTTKALTAEQGKVLKGLIDGLPSQNIQNVLTGGGTAVDKFLELLNAASTFQTYISGGSSWFRGTALNKELGITSDKIKGGPIGSATKSNSLIFDKTTDSNSDFKFPDKPSGTYTLATTADLGGGITSLQELMNLHQTAWLDDENDGSYINFFGGSAFNREFNLSTGNLDYSRGDLRISVYFNYLRGSFENFIGEVGVTGGKVLLSELRNYEGDEFTTNFKFEPALSTTNILIPASSTAGTHKVAIVGSTVPATATSPGAVGEIRYDANYAYFCVANNTWKRTAINTW